MSSITVIPEAWLRQEASPDAADFPEIADFAGKTSYPESTSLRQKAAAWQVGLK